MERPLQFRLRTALAIGAATVLVLAFAAQASASAGETAVTQGATLRLIRGPVVDGIAHIGLDIAMKPGWHTYWRYPGDSGVPPEITPGDSAAVKDLAVAYPPPQRFGVSGDETIGYEGDVILPIAVTLAKPGQSMALDLKVRLGICHDICLPVDETLSTRIDAAAPPAENDIADLTAAEAAIPKPVAAGAPFSIVSLKVDAGAKPPIAEVTLRGDDAAIRDLFVEGPEGWALPLPTRSTADAGMSRWRFALDGLPSGVKWTGAPLTFTVVGKLQSVTQTFVLN